MTIGKEIGMRRVFLLWACAVSCLVPVVCAPSPHIVDLSGDVEEQQITTAPHGHVVANCNIWSPDSQWIVYDCREKGEIFDSTRIECVNVETKAVRRIYTAGNRAACGVATWHPRDNKVVFILGPEKPDAGWSYGVSRRRGLVVDVDTGKAHALDAMNYAPPFARGALRGGSHVHVFDGTGQWVSFTYDDEILASRGGRNGAEPNQRNIGVAAPFGPVRVNKNHPRNNEGNWFSFVASKTVAKPRPGSDDISRATEEGWVGVDGYVKNDGTRQRRALAFQGEVTALDGRTHLEIYILDLPDMPTHEGCAPIAGTETKRPAPPRGVEQRRLTHTEDRKFRGMQGPRHWLRATADGQKIAFLMKDDDGVAQVFSISPEGGAIDQITHNPWPVSSTFTRSPDGRFIAYAMDNSIFMTDAASGKSFRLTRRADDERAPHRSACIFSPDGRRIAYLKKNGEYLQIFSVRVPAMLDGPDTVY